MTRRFASGVCRVIRVVRKVDCRDTNALCIVDGDRVIAGKRNWFTLVNFSNGKVEDDVNDESLGFVNCFLRLRDNKTILCGCSKEEFCFYDIESRKYIKNIHICR